MWTLAQNLPNWVNGGTLKVVVWLVIIGAIAVGKVVKAAREQAEIKRRADAAKRAELEALRTGRNPSQASSPAPQRTVAVQNVNPQQSAAQRLEELAAQRRAQIEELRRARAATASNAGRTSPPRTSPGAPRSAQPSGTRQPVAPQQQRQQQQPPRAGQAKTPQPAAQRPQHGSRQSQRQQPPPQPQQIAPRVPEEVDPGDSVTHRLVPDAKSGTQIPTGFTARRGAAFDGAPMSKGDWRRALILGEVLGQPVSMRPPGH